MPAKLSDEHATADMQAFGVHVQETAHACRRCGIAQCARSKIRDADLSILYYRARSRGPYMDRRARR